ncbi:hypothetical protein EFK50_13165 [Nocardioides marmoriginsengisoli]|uniref:Uncharacterized protein n=1 Tax=Nocardioides marmoriginsengisoli TaxID=661483 RepID=A0A3N0CI43_9ACTN|nr:hypothetical protein [Nocardioides marmoriginsengisoli]RNL62696.1 hypothetical protein EFK50_13165 [Nocardioides marmoriginsengisoli]
MNLFTIQNDLIADRTADAWYRVPSDGPNFHYRWQWGTGRDGGFSYVMGEHREQAVCRDEPSLTISWGLDVDDATDPNDRRHFDWADKFPDPSIRLFWADIFWNGALIDRVVLARVDGARGTIPLPNYNMQVTHFEAAIADLIDGLEGPTREYGPFAILERIGATIVGDHDREGAGSPR